MLQLCWNGSRIATRSGCRGRFGGVCAGGSCYNYRHFWAFYNRLPNKLYEKMKVAALDHSQETRSHLGMCLSPLMQKIQNLNIFARILIALRQKNNLGTKAKEDLSAATVEVNLIRIN